MLVKSLGAVVGAAGMLLSTTLFGSDADKPRPQKAVAPRTPTVIVAPADVRVDAAQDQQMPKTWIGVRCAPVPEALAAHIGREGVMIANVMKDSPADKAGIERYDVVVSLGDAKINSMEELIDAVGEVGTGKAATLAVIRGGHEKTLEITPVDRPSDGKMEFKFEEPEQEDASPDVQYFGHRMQRDPFGNWMLQPLGRIKDLPDDVRDSLSGIGGPSWHGHQGLLKNLQSNPFSMRIQIDPSDPDGSMFFFSDDDDNRSANVQIQINVNDDGAQLSIQRDADGKVHVKQTDKAGKATESTYDDMDAFREQAPNAYKTYRRFSGYRARPTITVPPQMKDLSGLQKDYQQKLEAALEKANESTRKAMEDLEKMQQKIQTRVEKRIQQSPAKDGAESHAESVSITVTDSGAVHLEISEDGNKRVFDFKNREDFKRREPELYERFQSMIDGAGDGARRTQRFHVVAAALG
ncbi:MAG: PDZ domain-containing protein [Planctomycetes bacterium]|nr:PDZ domain-containing protein [Planctomycetota bacterium]